MNHDHRYLRQTKLDQIGEDGQQAFNNAHILIVGVGGLGSAAAMVLAAGGIGTLTLNDFDRVEQSNLHRQIIFREHHLGELKTHAAKTVLQELNSDCRIRTLDYQLEDQELIDLIASADVVLDCSDNLSTRHAINRACVATSTPLVFGAALRLEGQLACFNINPQSPCLHCIYNNDTANNDDCENEGVLGTVPNIVGSMQALSAQLLLTENGEHLDQKLRLFDAFTLQWREIKTSKNPNCSVCAN